MRRVVVPVTLAVACLAAGSAGSAAREPARLQVVAKEYELLPSRYSLPAGRAIVELVNSGEDDHDLALRRAARGARTIRIGSTLPGDLRRGRATLAPGRYVLWCTVPGHRAQGMVTHLRVVRPPAARR